MPWTSHGTSTFLGFLFSFIFIVSVAYAAPLPVTEAFSFSAQKQDQNNFQLIFKIKPGYYLYKNSIVLHPLTAETYKIGQFQMPSAVLKLDKATGKQREVYLHQLQITVPILGKAAGEDVLSLQYQGCSVKGYCYPPQTQAFIVQITPDLALSQLIPTTTETPADAPDLFTHDTLGLLLLSFFGFGLLLAFTPCVLPMLPILSSIILSHQENASMRQAFWISLSYVIGVSITYASLGVAFALLGQNLQLFFQTPWMHALLAVLFTLLALSMFGLFEIRLPTFWQTWLNQRTQKKGRGPYLSALCIGFFSALILSPCVTPPLVGAFAYIAQTGNVWLGGSALFCLGLGSGTPLLFMTTAAAHYLPQAGYWMYGMKVLIGLLLLGLALYYLSLVLFTRPVSGITVKTRPELRAVLKAHSHEPIILDFYADWCSECVIIQKTVLNQPALTPLLKQVTLITVDVTPNHQESTALLKAYQVIAPPTFIFIAADGEEMQKLRLTGSVSLKAFMRRVREVLQED